MIRFLRHDLGLFEFPNSIGGRSFNSSSQTISAVKRLRALSRVYYSIPSRHSVLLEIRP